jgi:hypothetical protein
LNEPFAGVFVALRGASRQLALLLGRKRRRTRRLVRPPLHRVVDLLAFHRLDKPIGAFGRLAQLTLRRLDLVQHAHALRLEILQRRFNRVGVQIRIGHQHKQVFYGHIATLLPTFNQGSQLIRC